jgi:hypothetical protein
MQTIFDLLNCGYELETCGTNSIILKKDDCAFKLTREFSCEEVEEIIQLNKQLRDKGALVAKLFDYDKVKFHSVAGFAKVLGCIMEANRIGQVWQASRIDDLQNAEAEKCYVVPMMRYAYIDGENIFSDKRLNGIKLVNNNQKLRNSAYLHPAVKDILMKDLEQNLRFGEELSDKEIYKFLLDGKTILASGLSIDNNTGDNFVFGKTQDGRKGIFYIDLGGFEKMAKYQRQGETNLFRFTLDNLCKMIYVNTIADLGSVRDRQTQLLKKYSSVTKKFLKDYPEFKAQFDEYLDSSNYFDKLKQNLNADNREVCRE